MSGPAPKVEDVQKSSDSFAVDLSSSRPQASFFVAQSMLRALAAASTLVALSVMVTSKQTVVIFGMRFEAHYNYSSAFRFLLGVDAVVCGFSLMSLVFLCCLRRPGSNFRHYFFLFLHDLVIMVLMISGCSAASAVGYVGRYGEEKMGWLAVCNRVAKFCNRTLVSVVLSYLAFFCYFALSITSARKLALLSAH
ncbi:CASP-like protein 1F2 [Punica granatum]|uniref:CASP-like protein n=2 Tax=Punica granatum TaxID=22663 RepID=A0A2I0KBC5_PUNGR|nr:CASP-like protein 1F2 [Punica granatum]PKI65510.1 hypothetical protein CRG98_014098 [Punica granatum]